MVNETRELLKDARKTFATAEVTSKFKANAYTLLGGFGLSWLLSKMFKLGQANGAAQMGSKTVEMYEESIEESE